MSINVLVNGASGRMGQHVCAAVSADPELQLVAKTGVDDQLSDVIQKSKADVVVDFTDASVAFVNTATIIEANARPVIGTSGLTQQQVTELAKLCEAKNLGGIIAPNTSIGAIMMMRLAQLAVQQFPNVEIIEMHHDGKKDSPSGTAIKTAEMLAEARNELIELKPSKEIIPGARGASHESIPIHAVRLPGLVAHQEVIFGNTGETLTIRHDSINRECFMPGVLLACKKVMELNHLVYGLDQLI